MMNNNKILTVSYGTFSCTLEGFEDSFDTMKAIAEYFRDLAADDRYFGAEPPQPDAEMLARIAEREVARRVEAREHEGRIMLKAHNEAIEPQREQPGPKDSAPSAAVTTAAAAAATAVSLEEETVPSERTQAYSAPYTDTPEPPAAATGSVTPETYDALSEAEAVAPIAEEAATEASPEELAEPEEFLAEVETVEEFFENDMSREEASEPQTEPEEAAIEDMSPEESAAAFFADSSLAGEIVEEYETEEAITVEAFTGYIPSGAAEYPEHEDRDATLGDVAAGDADTFAEGAEDFAEVAEGDAAEEFVAEEVEPTPPIHSGQDTFAEKLERIRAVVSQREDLQDASEYEENGEAPAGMTGFGQMEDFGADETDVSETIFDEPVAETQDVEDAAEHVEVSPAEDEDVRAAQADGSEEIDEQVISEAAQDITEALDHDDASSYEDEDVDADDLDAILNRIDLDASDDSTREEDDEENLFDDAADETTEVQYDHVSVQGRVLKVKHADLEAALAAGELEEYEDDGFADREEMGEEWEHDLHGGAAAVEEEKTQVRPAARASLPEIDTGVGNDLSRLMAEADHQMAEPAGEKRRSAFAHLRAAVAARFADRSMDAEEKAADEDAKAYRSDLAEVVKPRRPAPMTDRAERPVSSRPLPLKLVAEQRVDADDARHAAPIAPRRVGALDDDFDTSGHEAFAAYAEERGASALPELLEAAASYLCFVEDMEEFSRPQLMGCLRQAAQSEFSREEGLRAFGQLLRTGKIEKIKGGRFVASEAIGYKPHHRAAG